MRMMLRTVSFFLCVCSEMLIQYISVLYVQGDAAPAREGCPGRRLPRVQVPIAKGNLVA